MTAAGGADRRKGTSANAGGEAREILVTYREFAPSPALVGHVRAFFSCTPGAVPPRGHRPVIREVAFTREDSFCSPLLADGRTSLILNLGAVCELGKGWTGGAPVEARAIGALRCVGGPAPSTCAEMVGAYLHPGATEALLHVPAVELTDGMVDLDGLWRGEGVALAEHVAELDEARRVEELEEALLCRLRQAREQASSLDVPGLARWIGARQGALTVSRLADAAGVSRQHLTRVFRQKVGVSPKRFCRLARFQAGLAYAGAGSSVPWAQVAVELGYADQSHMIAEFREMSSVTPETLARERWFHPFILEARGRGPAPNPAPLAAR